MREKYTQTFSYTKFLIGIIIFSIFSFIASVIQIGRGNIGGFEPLFYGIGFVLYSAFNWADVFVFSFLWIILSIVLLKLQRKIYFWITFFAFWFIRSLGETIYSFLQQFNPSVKPWLSYMPRSFLENSFIGHFIYVKYWIVEQTLFQSISVLSLLGLVYTIGNFLCERKR